jgi:hypothetical protein
LILAAFWVLFFTETKTTPAGSIEQLNPLDSTRLEASLEPKKLFSMPGRAGELEKKSRNNQRLEEQSHHASFTSDVGSLFHYFSTILQPSRSIIQIAANDGNQTNNSLSPQSRSRFLCVFSGHVASSASHTRHGSIRFRSFDMSIKVQLRSSATICAFFVSLS